MAETERPVPWNPETSYERSDISLFVIGVAAIGLFAYLVIAPLVLRGAYPTSLADVDRWLTINPPQPQLQTAPQEDLAAFRAEEEARLNGYGWVDRARGIVHIPITEAMKRKAQQGIDGFPRGRP